MFPILAIECSPGAPNAVSGPHQSLDEVEDERSGIVRTDPKTEILKLKQETGKDILAGGVDGIGPQERLKLTLVGSETLGSGCLVLRYSDNPENG